MCDGRSPEPHVKPDERNSHCCKEGPRVWNGVSNEQIVYAGSPPPGPDTFVASTLPSGGRASVPRSQSRGFCRGLTEQHLAKAKTIAWILLVLLVYLFKLTLFDLC